MKFTTETGSQYIWNGPFLTRLSEKPVKSAATWLDRPEYIIQNKLIERAIPDIPEVGYFMYFEFADGKHLRTTPIKEISYDD